MITTTIVCSLFLNLVFVGILVSLSKEKPKGKIIYKDKIVYKDKPVEKIVYRDKIVEKVVEKVVYKDRILHQFIKEEPKVSSQKQELLDALAELKAKKKKSKKDLDNIYTIEKVLPNL